MSGKTAAKNREMTYVVTSTFYSKEGVRPDLALEFAEGVEQLPNTLLIMIDGGSYHGFYEEVLEAAPHTVFLGQDEPGMDAARKQGFETARSMLEEFQREHPGAKVAVVWSEPEKVDFVRSIPKVVAPILEGNAHVVIPNRTNMDSYPESQAHSEKIAKLFVSKLVGYPCDQFFGPVGIGREVLHFFIDIDPYMYGNTGTEGWLRIHLARLWAQSEGFLVSTVKIRYKHPRAQTEEESGDLLMDMKRIVQLHNLSWVTWKYAFDLGLTKQPVKGWPF